MKEGRSLRKEGYLCERSAVCIFRMERNELLTETVQCFCNNQFSFRWIGANYVCSFNYFFCFYFKFMLIPVVVANLPILCVIFHSICETKLCITDICGKLTLPFIARISVYNSWSLRFRIFMHVVFNE